MGKRFQERLRKFPMISERGGTQNSSKLFLVQTCNYILKILFECFSENGATKHLAENSNCLSKGTVKT